LLGAGVREDGIRKNEIVAERNRATAERLPAPIVVAEIDGTVAPERGSGTARAAITLCSLRAVGTCRACGPSRSRHSGGASGASQSPVAPERPLRFGADVNSLDRAVLDFFDVTTIVAAVPLVAATTAGTTAAITAFFIGRPLFRRRLRCVANYLRTEA
jgi:hypothetical protein